MIERTAQLVEAHRGAAQREGVIGGALRCEADSLTLGRRVRVEAAAVLPFVQSFAGAASELAAVAFDGEELSSPAALLVGGFLSAECARAVASRLSNGGAAVERLLEAAKAMCDIAVRKLGWAESLRERAAPRFPPETVRAGDWRALARLRRGFNIPVFDGEQRRIGGMQVNELCVEAANAPRPLIVRALESSTPSRCALLSRARVRFGRQSLVEPLRPDVTVRPRLAVHVPLDFVCFSTPTVEDNPPRPARRYQTIFLRGRPRPTPRLIFLVHGLEGSLEDMRVTASVLRYLLPGFHIHACESLEDRTQEDIRRQGARLAREVRAVLATHYAGEEAQVSLVAHSLGGLIARAACLHLPELRGRLRALATLGCPHLGCDSPRWLVWAGVRVLSAFTANVSLRQMALGDGEQFLEQLSVRAGLDLFEHVVLVGAAQDGYVALESALLAAESTMCRAALERPGRLRRLARVVVDVPEANRGWDKLLGRQAHLELLLNTNLLLSVWKAVCHLL